MNVKLESTEIFFLDVLEVMRIYSVIRYRSNQHFAESIFVELRLILAYIECEIRYSITKYTHPHTHRLVKKCFIKPSIPYYSSS